MLDSVISAIIALVKLAAKAFSFGKTQMGSDYLSAADHLAREYDVNLNKVIQEVQRKEEK